MKGLSINVIGGVVLALIGVTVMVGLFTDLSPLDAESGFCSVYNGLNPSLPDSITPTVAGCKDRPAIDYKKIKVDSKDEFALKLAVGAKDCLEEFRGYNVEFKRCKAWNIADLDSAVDESFLNDKMEEHDICPQLIENSPGCGSKDQIKFRMSEISEGDFVLVGYNSTSQGFVEVK